MIKRILIALALALGNAQAPLRSYLEVSSVFGAVPALAWVACHDARERDRVGSAAIDAARKIAGQTACGDGRGRPRAAPDATPRKTW